MHRMQEGEGRKVRGRDWERKVGGGGGGIN